MMPCFHIQFRTWPLSTIVEPASGLELPCEHWWCRKMSEHVTTNNSVCFTTDLLGARLQSDPSLLSELYAEAEARPTVLYFHMKHPCCL